MSINSKPFAITCFAIVIAVIALLLLVDGLTCNGNNAKVFTSSTPEQQRQWHDVDESGAGPVTTNGNGRMAQPLANASLMLEKLNLERHGALGSVELHVKDAYGAPVSNANVHLYFTLPKANDPKGRVEGVTDFQGKFSATKKTNYECIWKVSKDGYHTSCGEVKFSPHFAELSPTTGKWTKGPIVVDVLLKTKSDAHLIHGDRLWHELKFPTNTWVGFDFIKCDCVSPYGKGQTSHIEFRSKSWGRPPFSKGGTYGFTNTLEIQTFEGGMAVADEEPYSSSPFHPIANMDLPGEQQIFTYARTKDAILRDARMKKATYLIFKTKCSDSASQNGAFHFGILRKIEFSPGRLRFEYFFNAEPEDRRIDGDIHSQSRHGK